MYSKLLSKHTMHCMESITFLR